jgi:hypothetical protein
MTWSIHMNKFYDSKHLHLTLSPFEKLLTRETIIEFLDIIYGPVYFLKQ